MTVQKKTILISGLGLLGNAAGILVAVKRKSGFWGGVGWFLVGGMIGAGIGYVTASVIPGPDEDKEVIGDSGNLVSTATPGIVSEKV